MTYPITAPTVAFLTCACGHVLTVHNGVAWCEHTVTVVGNGVEQKILQQIRHHLTVTTELVGGGAK